MLRRLLILSLLAACDEGRGAPMPGPQPVTRSDGGPSADASTSRDAGMITAPPMGLVLAVGGAVWTTSNGARMGLIVGVTVANGTGSMPAPLAAAGFQLQTRGGAVLAATSEQSPGFCADDVSVAAGASLGCALSFQVPVGDMPITLRYQSGSRMAEAQVPACDAGHPEGLCAMGEVCDRGRCEGPCGESFCVGDQVCLGGQCGDACGPMHAGGLCEVGTCVNGSCDTSCYSINLSAPGCSDCTVESGCVFPEGCANATMCLSCVGTDDVCSCANANGCQGCSNARSFFDCMVSNCPSCRD